MAIYLNKDIIEKSGYSASEIITMLCVVNRVNYSSTINLLRRKGLIFCPITKDPMDLINYELTHNGIQVLDAVILDSDEHIDKKEDLESLAVALRELYPKGKKPGTNCYWADSVGVIIRRLQNFFKRYGTHYSHEQIIEATRQYVSSFNGSYDYMKLLKYFIFKDKKGLEGVENESELATYIDNAGQISESIGDWTSELK